MKISPSCTAFLFLIGLLASVSVNAQTSVPFTSDRWQFSENGTQTAHATMEYLGQPALKLTNSTATLNGANFTNGIIEYDMALTPGRMFVYVNFRIQDADNYECFYVRPHQSGNPDATQYMPVFNGLGSWQLHQGEGFAAPISFPFNQWIHVKLVVSGSQMEVYLGDMVKPALFVPHLKRPLQAGALAVSAQGDAHFANFSFKAVENPPLKSVAKPEAPTPKGTITSWQVSKPFPEKDLSMTLTASQKTQTWKTMKGESSGILNLAEGARWSEKTNTVFARLVINSDRDQLKPLELGFSDRVRVFLNGTILYIGHDEFLSRDYRFFGTVGYYDEIFLSLKKGRNELWIAISEDFGGWGIKGLLTDQQGITVVRP